MIVCERVLLSESHFVVFLINFPPTLSAAIEGRGKVIHVMYIEYVLYCIIIHVYIVQFKMRDDKWIKYMFNHVLYKMMWKYWQEIIWQIDQKCQYKLCHLIQLIMTHCYKIGNNKNQPVCNL